MAAFDQKFTDEQREAVAVAFVDQDQTATAIMELARAGRLEGPNGYLAPFDVSHTYVRDLAGKLRRRRLGLVGSPLAEIPSRDAIEVLRRRLVSAADWHLREHEKMLRQSPSKADPERLRQIARAVREAAALPGRDDATRPPAPGFGPRAERGGDTRGGLAGRVLNEHRRTRQKDGPPAR